MINDQLIDTNLNLRNVLEKTIRWMEVVEDSDKKGEFKRDFVIRRMKQELGDLFPSYEHEIDTIMESVIFMTKLGRVILINNQNIKKACAGCFNF